MKTDALAAWLAEEEARPFDGFWGRQDCILFFSDWVKASTGRDPAAPWRGRYGSALGASRLIARAGGLHALVDQGLGSVGWTRKSRPRRGQVGLVEAAPWGPQTNGLRHAGGVCLGGEWWAGRGHNGELTIARAVPAAIWGPERGGRAECRER